MVLKRIFGLGLRLYGLRRMQKGVQNCPILVIMGSINLKFCHNDGSNDKKLY
jgi:hypothetical protein